MNRIFLIDVSAYLHRAMHVVYGERSADMPATDSTFIEHAALMLANTMVKLKVTRMAVVCDSTEHSFRCEAFPAYKAGRKAHVAVFAAQAPRFYDALRDIDVSVFAEPKYEADDLIATLAGEEPGTPYVIVTHDKDLLALVCDERQVSAYNPMTDVFTTAPNVYKKYGVRPDQFYDYLGLVGDTADGIPGVDGIGPKTAAKLLSKFGTLEGIYNAPASLSTEVNKAQYQSLIANKDNALLSRVLACPIICDELAVTGHGELWAPEPDFVRDAIFTTSKKNHDL